MTARKGRYTRLVVGAPTWAYDFSGQTNSLEVALSAERMETTAFQDTARTYIADVATGTITSNGYFESSTTAAENVEAALAGAIAASTALHVAALIGTDTDACPAYVARNTNAGGLTVGAEVGGLITVQGEWPSGDGMTRALRLWQGTISATGAQTGPAYLDLGATAPGSNGGYFWLFVTAKTGTMTNATVLVQMDDNSSFGSPTTKGTFTVSGTGVAMLTATGSVERYLRLSTSSLGGATNFTVVALAAVQGITYN